MTEGSLTAWQQYLEGMSEQYEGGHTLTLESLRRGLDAIYNSRGFPDTPFGLPAAEPVSPEGVLLPEHPHDT